MERRRLAGLTVAAAVLILVRLGGTYLWSDEAHTALLARSILAHGVPKGGDALNSFSVDLTGAASDMDGSGTWILTPWLPYYLAAPLAGLDPEGSEAALRLPFALFGIATVPLLYLLARRIFGAPGALLSCLFLLACVPFLLYSRQCRYYSPAMFFSTWLLLAYDKLLCGERGAARQLFAAQALLFHSNYMIWLGIVAAPAIHYAATSIGGGRWKGAAAWAAAALAIHLPWAALAHGKARADMSDARLFLANLRDLSASLNDYLLPLAMLALLAWVRWRNGGPAPSRARLLLGVVAASLGAAAFAPVMFFRYLCGIIPVAALLKAWTVLELDRVGRRWAVLAACALGLSNVLSIPGRLALPHSSAGYYRWLNPRYGELLRWPFLDYLDEVSHEYRGPIRGIVEHLRPRARDGQKVAIVYGDLPLKFYLPRLRIVGGLTGEDLRAEGAERADWIILRGPTFPALRYIQEYLLANARLGRDYRRVELGYPDFRFENIPEPEMHRFRTPWDAGPLVLFERVAP